MDSRIKKISLNQASKISGYHQDYLGALIRKGEIKGHKIVGNWFTTEKEIKNYIFKQKVSHGKWAILDFLSLRWINIFSYTFIIMLALISGLHSLGNKGVEDLREIVNTKLTDTNEFVVVVDNETIQ